MKNTFLVGTFNMKKFYIFDFDGTLVDSMPFWAQKMLNILNKAGVDYPKDIITTIATLGDVGSAKYFIDVLNVTFTEQQMFEMMDEFAMPKYCDVIVLKNQVKDTLLKLKAHGHSLNVLTASPHKMLDPCLKRNGIYDLFDNVWSTDDFGMTKSNPEIYLSAVHKLGANIQNTIFFDDNINAINTAKTAGLTTVGVYDESGKTFVDKMKNIADKFIYSFSEI